MNYLKAIWAGVRIGLMLMTCILVLGYIFSVVLLPETMKAELNIGMLVSSPVGWVVVCALCFMLARNLVNNLVD